MGRPNVDLALVEIAPLSGTDVTEGFCCEDDDLDDFIRTDALVKQRLGVVRVYLARYEGELVGYVAILMDCIVLRQSERKKLKLTSNDHPSVPALKVGRLATSASFKQRFRGMGETMMGFALALGTRLATEAGCRLLTVDAYPKSVGFYEKLGFVRNRSATPRRASGWKSTVRRWFRRTDDDGERISMRFDIKATPPPSWAL